MGGAGELQGAASPSSAGSPDLRARLAALRGSPAAEEAVQQQQQQQQQQRGPSVRRTPRQLEHQRVDAVTRRFMRSLGQQPGRVNSQQARSRQQEVGRAGAAEERVQEVPVRVVGHNRWRAEGWQGGRRAQVPTPTLVRGDEEEYLAYRDELARLGQGAEVAGRGGGRWRRVEQAGGH